MKSEHNRPRKITPLKNRKEKDREITNQSQGLVAKSQRVKTCITGVPESKKKKTKSI